MVDDRKKSLNMLNQPQERLQRGAEVGNEDPLPKAQSTDLSAGLQLWCEYNSWQVCKACKRLQPRELTPAGLEGPLSPWCAKGACIFCRNVRSAPVDVLPPDVLSGLSATILDALKPVAAYFGPYVCSKDRFGRGNGYRSHSAMVTFEWQEAPVVDRVRALPAGEADAAAKALRWLLEHSGPEAEATAYGHFFEEQQRFFERNPAPEPRQRKRWLRFLESEGLECALWPHLFLQRRQCLTWARLQSTQRQARGQQKTTLEQRLGGDAGAEQPLEDVTGAKRSYMALVLSQTLDYGLSYELLHFAFDLALWTDLGAKRNLGFGVPMRLMLKGHSFSSEYWKDLHRGLVDLTRQKGFPPIFSTHSPFEWSWPNHCALVKAMDAAGRGQAVFRLLFRCRQYKLVGGRLEYPVMEALHQAHC